MGVVASGVNQFVMFTIIFIRINWEIVLVFDIFKDIINKKEKAIDDIIRGIDIDILGAYFFRKSTVRLYWKVIGLFAGLLEVAIQDLTVVVLIHELAHAYSHVGRDIDGKQWETGLFAETDADIVEGIAQFYTWVVSDKLSDRAPGVKNAFEALLSKQGGPYVANCGWIEDTARIGEVMRDCLIETRSNGIRELKEFSKRVEIAGKRFGHKSSKTSSSL